MSRFDSTPESRLPSSERKRSTGCLID